MNPVLADDPQWILDAGVDEGYEWGVTHDQGFRCGWVRIPPGHPWHGKTAEDIEPRTGVHGGLVYAVPDTESGWWVGFHCAGFGDAPDPSLDPAARFVAGQTIKSTAYVRAECMRLIRTAAEAARDRSPIWVMHP